MSSIGAAPARRVPRRLGDRLLAGMATSAGVAILATLAGVVVFLLIEAWPAITAPAAEIPGGRGLVAFIAPLAFGTVLAAVLAVALAVPFAVAIALFVSHYAPRPLAGPLASLIDLLAAVPSVVYGLWGVAVLAPASRGPIAWLADHLGFLPLFAGPPSVTGRTMLVAAVVLAVMILPITCGLAREAFAQAPRAHLEAAYALGATRWEAIRMAVLPFGRAAVASAALLGLGRALGETMAVTIILSATGAVTFNLISSDNPSTIAANIALDFPESAGVAVNALIASGLALFAITFAVNLAARAVVGRRARRGG